MLPIVEKITEHLLKKLPSESGFFSLEDLRKAGIPLFLVEKIHIDLLRNLADSISLPDTEWANMKSERVHAAWQAFLATIEAEVLLPDSYKRSVLEGSVEDVVEQLVTPRHKLLDLIFGTDESVDINVIRERSRDFVVYPYLGRALTRYLERKNQSSINRDKASDIIIKVDERVTGHYTPLNWGQLLEPWFEIMGDEIETDLVRRFFEDKQLEKNENSFESAPDVVNRAHLIEYLTTGPIIAERIEEESVDEKIIKEMEPEAEKEPETEVEQKDDVEDNEETTDQSQEEEVVFSLEKKGVSSTTEDEPKKEIESEGQSPSKAEDTSESEHSNASISKKFQDRKEKDDLPIWQKFLSAQESEEKEESSIYNSILNNDKQSEKDKEETTLADAFISKDEDNETGYHPDGEKLELSKIRELLRDREQSFIEHIFHGNKKDYIEAVHKLDGIHDWRKASSYLYREVFKHNGVSLYSDEAIEFTDRLQRWYQNKSQN